MTIQTRATKNALATTPGTDGRRAILAYLREVRHDRGLSLEQVAGGVDISPVALAGALWGDVDFSPEALARLAQTLEVEHTLVAPLAVPSRLLSLWDDPWNGQDDSTGPAGWPLVVAKEGAD
jgi:transcriptional regulator with XRE-family HTH domain